MYNQYNGISGYLIIEFLVEPYKNIDQYVCVPESWQRWRDHNGEVAIAYPEENPQDTSVRVLNNEDCSKRWKIYMAKVCYKKDSYQHALQFIASLEENKSTDLAYRLQNMKTENIPIKVKNEEKTITTTPIKKIEKKDIEDISPSTSTPKIEKNKPSPSSTINQNTGKEKNEVNITPQNKTKNSPYKIPVDFNPKDLKDMFRHNSPNLGEVVELLPNTGVLIEVNVLETKYKNYSDMVEGLMKGIFTNKALRNCTISGEPPIAKNHSESDTRPALDQDAREAIIKYVYENCYKHWKEGRNSIEYAMRKVLTKSRPKQ